MKVDEVDGLMRQLDEARQRAKLSKADLARRASTRRSLSGACSRPSGRTRACKRLFAWREPSAFGSSSHAQLSRAVSEESRPRVTANDQGSTLLGLLLLNSFTSASTWSYSRSESLI
jgi:hypothetical protein